MEKVGIYSDSFSDCKNSAKEDHRVGLESMDPVATRAYALVYHKLCFSTLHSAKLVKISSNYHNTCAMVVLYQTIYYITLTKILQEYFSAISDD